MQGRFITFEGIDGAGKSTHLAALAAHLEAAGQSVIVTREPGGTPLAEQRLRELFLHRPMDRLTELLLVFAARRDHLEQVIRPALARGTTVLCDRFTDASFAYQGAGRGVDLGWLRTLESWVHGDLQPDLTLWFDASPEVAAQRRSASRPSSGADRLEVLDTAFFARVREGYEARLRADPRRIVRIDAEGEREAVWQRVADAVEGRPW